MRKENIEEKIGRDREHRHSITRYANSFTEIITSSFNNESIN